MVQRVLEQVDDDSLHVAVVWIAALRTDDFQASLQSRRLIPDKRVRHYWDGAQAIGTALAPVLETNMAMAWDVYLAYGPDASWEAAPPKPEGWLHQKGSEDPERYMNEEDLLAMIRSVLDS